MLEITRLLHTQKREDLDFIDYHIDQIKSLEECVMILSAQLGTYGAKSILECQTRLRNIDLWIDANIIKYPGLQSFRLKVLKEMNQCGVQPWPSSVYMEDNIYKE